MSYKAFVNLKEYIEVETLKTMSYEQINEVLCMLHDKNKSLEDVLRQITLTGENDIGEKSTLDEIYRMCRDIL